MPAQTPPTEPNQPTECPRCHEHAVINYIRETGKPAPRPYCYRCGWEAA